MKFNVSKRGVEFIAAHEGEVLKAYRCPAGIWTIGVGHTSAAGAPKVKPGMRITRDESRRILAEDLKKFDARCNQFFKAQAQHEHDGAVSFDLNTGAINRATWAKKFNQGDRAAAAESIMQWNKARVKGVLKPLKGLTRRRGEERDLIFKGSYPGSSGQSKFNADEYLEKLDRLGFRGPNAVVNFQREHKQLQNDNILGRATAAQIDRVLDYKKKSKQDAGGIAAGGGGAIASTQGPEWLLYLVIAFGVIAVIWAMYRAMNYRDEIQLSMRKLRK